MVTENWNGVDTTVWKYDTACSDHCTPFKELFHTYEPCDDEIFTAKVGVGMQIVGKGTVRFVTPNGYGELVDVLHVPDMARNLLSGPTLMDKGINVSLGQEIQFSKNGQQIISGLFNNGYWSVQLDYCKEVNEVVAKRLPNLQHQRFGHLHDKALVKNGLINEKETLEFCNACQLAKSAVLRYSKGKGRDHRIREHSMIFLSPFLKSQLANSIRGCPKPNVTTHIEPLHSI